MSGSGSSVPKEETFPDTSFKETNVLFLPPMKRRDEPSVHHATRRHPPLLPGMFTVTVSLFTMLSMES